MNKVLVCGAGGFIGGHLVTSLKSQGLYVIGVDLKHHEYKQDDTDQFVIADLRNFDEVLKVVTSDIDTVYQLAADMGGAGYIFTGNNDADILSNSLQINLNIAQAMKQNHVGKLFFTSSACVYPQHNQTNLNTLTLKESSAYPADPDSEYGWEKLTSERLYLSYAKQYGLRVRIARLHNVFGPMSCYDNGKEKSIAAICRKIAQTKNGVIEIWGNGNQTRSFLHIDQCIKGIHLLQNSDVELPINLGSDEMISINQLAHLIADLAGKKIVLRHVDGPIGVAHRTSDNSLIQQKLGWKPNQSLASGLLDTYNWIDQRIKKL